MEGRDKGEDTVKRKSPIRHTVRSHKREDKWVKSFYRGRGRRQKYQASKVVVKTERDVSQKVSDKIFKNLKRWVRDMMNPWMLSQSGVTEEDLSVGRETTRKKRYMDHRSKLQTIIESGRFKNEVLPKIIEYLETGGPKKQKGEQGFMVFMDTKSRKLIFHDRWETSYTQRRHPDDWAKERGLEYITGFHAHAPYTAYPSSGDMIIINKYRQAPAFVGGIDKTHYYITLYEPNGMLESRKMMRKPR